MLFFENIDTKMCQPPKESGVYAIFICDTNKKAKRIDILYIGSSKNIHKRVMNKSHPYQTLTSTAEYPFLIGIKWITTTKYISLEREMIKHYKPKLNTQHNG